MQMLAVRAEDFKQYFAVQLLFIVVETTSEIKIFDVIILAKYAQGGVVFSQYYNYLKFMKPKERSVFLFQIGELIGHYALDDSVVRLAAKPLGWPGDYLITNKGINQQVIQKLMLLPESELESTFKSLLTTFSICYHQGYQKHKNATDKFWYWDYTDETVVDRLDANQRIRLDDVLWL
jgi:hypothetical protein